MQLESKFNLLKAAASTKFEISPAPATTGPGLMITLLLGLCQKLVQQKLSVI